MLKISIVTITLNNEETIEQTVKSILNQNYPNLEYIVIDGGSTDSTLNILNNYKNKFKYFKSSPDKGVYDAMNKGIAQATGDLIGFVNGGDFIYENVIMNNNSIFFFEDHYFNIVSTMRIVKMKIPTNFTQEFLALFMVYSFQSHLYFLAMIF